MWREYLCAVTLTVAVVAVEDENMPRCVLAQCVPVNFSGHEREYTVEDKKIVIGLVDGHLNVYCNGADVLWSGSLPSFPRRVRCASVRVSRCPARGAGATLARALEALNVTLALGDTQGGLTLDSLPTEPRLGARHFAGLERLAGLTVSAASRAEPEPGFLAPLRHLRELALLGVRLDPADLDDPPPNLTRLNLRGTGLDRLPEKIYELSHLSRLDINEKKIAEITILPTLITLTLKYATLPMKDTLSLEALTLDKWRVERPEPLRRCAALISLKLLAPAAEALPNRWVANCSRLKSLEVKYAKNLKMLPSDLLLNAKELRNVTFMKTGLETLPPGLFREVPNLCTLDLTRNRLKYIESGAFAGPRALAALDLSYNKLGGPSALAALSGLRHLERLNLANNPRLGGDGVCDSGDSPIVNLTKLSSLSLFKTNITRVCPDWRTRLTLLETLNLSQTSISELTSADLRYTRNLTGNRRATVHLENTPISVRFTEADYNESLTAPASGVTLQLNSMLACDCHMYWTWRILTQTNNTILEGLKCRSGHSSWPLKTMSADEMLCRADEECSTVELKNCSCRARPHAGATPARSHADAAPARLVVVVDCERGAWDHVPALPAAPGRLYRLRLAHNNISALHAADLPPALQELDLRNNSLEDINDKTVSALVVHSRQLRLRLALNRLSCDCSASLLRLLNDRSDAVADLATARCRNGTKLSELWCPAREKSVPPEAWLAGTLLAFLVISSVAIACFVCTEWPLLFKLLLYRWGVLRCPTEPDDGRQFDAFVSFSHEDEEVVRALVAGLEAGPAPYRLCLHYRDWVPGRWIPDQIVQSVRQSRRTLALVSRHFLRSTWARAEFREAHALALRDSRPRLVVVLLEEPAALPLDAELSRYLRRNTYVRWGDAWFWDKLRLALPKPRPADPELADPASLRGLRLL